MKKTAILCFLLILLCGCTVNKEEFDKEKMRQSISDALDIDMPLRRTNNCVKKYYSYYLFPEIGKESDDEISDVFYYCQQQAVLYLDIAGIISKSIYATEGREYLYLREFNPQSEPFFEYSGRFTNSDDKINPFHLYVGNFSDNEYLLTIQASDFIVSSIADKSQIYDLTYEMIKVIRSAHVNETLVLKNFYIANPDSSTSSVTLFDYMLPENGVLLDYLESWKSDPSFIIYDNEEEESE